MSDDSSNKCEDVVEYVKVVEMVNTLLVEGKYFLMRHQYPYVRTIRKEIAPALSRGYAYDDHNVVLVEGKEYDIPAHIGILTNKIKTELEQDTQLYYEQMHRDNTPDRLNFWLDNLPLAETHETYGKAVYTGDAYRDALLKEKGES